MFLELVLCINENAHVDVVPLATSYRYYLNESEFIELCKRGGMVYIDLVFANPSLLTIDNSPGRVRMRLDNGRYVNVWRMQVNEDGNQHIIFFFSEVSGLLEDARMILLTFLHCFPDSLRI
jgi:hypothetical protein